MSDRDHKTIGALAGIVTFDSSGIGPYVDTLTVMANCGASVHYPKCRITMVVSDLCCASLTVQQSRELRATLELAERDVVSGCPAIDEAESANG